MTARERLHRLVDRLPDEEAERLLAQLESGQAGRGRAYDSAAPDDEPETGEERESVERGLADLAAGRVRPAVEVWRELGV